MYNEKLYCPVCKVFLGKRFHTDFFTSHCAECKTIFTWWPKSKKPKSVLDSKLKNRCNCGRCGR